MKKIISVLFVFLMLVFSGCMSEEPVLSEENNLSSIAESEAPSDSESESSQTSEETSSENYDAILEDWVKNLEPMQVFETEKEYPFVILEIFDILMEQEEFEVFKSKELLSVYVSGDENAFYVSYLYVTNENIDGHLMIRVHKLESGEFALVARGGGPLAYGLEKSELTLKDLTGISSKNSYIKTEICPDIDIGHDGGTLFSGGKLYVSAVVHKSENSADEKLIIDLETGKYSEWEFDFLYGNINFFDDFYGNVYQLIYETGPEVEEDYDYTWVSFNKDGTNGTPAYLHFNDFGISDITGGINGNWYINSLGEIRIFDSDFNEIHRIENLWASCPSGFFRLLDGRVAVAHDETISIIDPETFKLSEYHLLYFNANRVFPGNSEYDIIYTVIDNSYNCSLYGLDFGKSPELLIDFSDYFENDFAVMNAHIDEESNIFAVLGTDKLRYGATEIYKFEISK